MALTDKEIEILTQEIEDGKIAEKAYGLYIEGFIARSKQRIFDAFEQLSIENVEQLHKLKLMQYAVSALEQEIKDDIFTKDMAEKTLMENEEN